jgi:hypothetical protein
LNRSSSTLIGAAAGYAATSGHQARLKVPVFTQRSLKMRKAAMVLATVAAVGVSALAAPASAYTWGPGYGYGTGYFYGYAFRDYIPVPTYDGYVPVAYGQYAATEYHDAPVYLGYRQHTVIHPAGYVGGPWTVHHRRHW